jgi:hypothetical protein
MNGELDPTPRSAWKIKLRWRDMPFRMKALSIVAVIGCSIFGSLLLAVGYIETVALTQPSTPDHVFSHLHEIKGGVRFLTDQQEYIYTIVKPAMIVTFAITALLVCSFNRMNDRVEREHKRRLIDKIADDFERSNSRPDP